MDAHILDDFSSHLLSLTTPAARVAAIENVLASDPQSPSQSLESLLDVAARWVGSDPTLAGQWLSLLAEVAHKHALPAHAARATYLLAQTHSARGEFDQALKHIASARDQYLLTGLTLDALRTNTGRIHVLKELGRYIEALSVANDVLLHADTASATDTAADASTRLRVAALAHQNRGVCFEQMGRYDEALTAYQAAEDRFRKLNATESIGDIINNRGVILLHLGRAGEALRTFETAADLFAHTDDAVRQALTQVNMGYAHTQQGDDVKGLAAFEQATRTLTAVHADAEAQVAMLDMAEAYLSLNLHAEACAAYQNVLALTERTHMQHEQARAQWGLGIALAALGQHVQAAHAFETARALFDEAGNTPMLCNVLLQQSALSARRGDREQALALAQRTVALCAAGHWPLQQAEAQLRVAELSSPHDANAGLAEVQRLVETLGLPRLQTRLQTLLGQAAVAGGHWDTAEAHFKAAIQHTEAHRAKLDRAYLRATFAQDKDALYSNLIHAMLTRNAEAKTIFAWVEQAKARALLDLLAGTPASASYAENPLVAMLQARLSELYTKLLLGPSANAPNDFAQLQMEAIEVERQISHAQVRAASLSPAQADPIATPLSPDDIQSRLPTDVTLLSYYICQGEVIAFVLSQKSLQMVRRVTTLETLRPLLEQLRAEWQRFQLGDAFVNKHRAQLEASVKETLRDLHQALLGALQAALPQASAAQPHKLVIVPHGLLHQVPFQALFDGAAYLIDTHEVSYAPSCTAYALSQIRAAPATPRQVVFGIADADIPWVKIEAQSVAQTVAGELYLDEAATVAMLRERANGCQVLHLACHGLFRADNPMFSALRLHDGWLKATDVLGLKLIGASVVLSACDSGRSEVLGGDELMGLVRAFLGAGAASLLVSQWLVRDDSTAMLMTAWYTHLKQGLGRCAALRQAQLHTRTAFSHPYYWAPFVLIGQRE